MKKPYKNILTGFTLAEVLITLLIIGIVASLVIPGLVHDSQNAELKTAWKKTYSDLNQATKMLLLDNGGTLKGAFSNSSDMATKYSQYLVYTRFCPNNVYGNCWNNLVNVKGLNGYVDLTWTTNFGGIITNSGAFVLFLLTDNTCSYDAWSNLNVCGRIFIDVNGFKKPNVIGKDIFMIHVKDLNLYPFGIAGDVHSGDCTSNGYGWSCAINYLSQ